MIKRAFPSGHHPTNHSRWKARLCYGFVLLIFITLVVLLVAWNILCGLPSMNPLLVSEGEPTSRKWTLNDSLGPPVDLRRRVVEIYYEVLCPDSRYFILKEFNPVYAQFKNYIKPSFIPFGKASFTTSEGKLSFNCQHGETECQGNMIHSCAISHVANEETLVAYIGCMINNDRYPEQVGKQCAEQLQLDWEPILKCAKGTEGPDLLKGYGEKTQALKPAVSFIPTITIDGSQDGQRELLKGWQRFLCKNILASENLKDCQDGLNNLSFT